MTLKETTRWNVDKGLLTPAWRTCDATWPGRLLESFLTNGAGAPCRCAAASRSRGPAYARRSLAARIVRDDEVGGQILLAPSREVDSHS